MKTDKLQSHKLADLLPNMSNSEMADLVSDMRENGYRSENPIYLFEGKILDGRNRYAASNAAKVNPTFVEYTGSDAWKFVVSQNLHRRHLDETQRAGVASRRANMERGGSGSNQFSKSAKLQNSISIETAAEEMNVSPRTVATYRAVAIAMPELVEKMDSGEMTANKAYKEVEKKRNESKPTPKIPDNTYRVFYADPPWKYNSGDQHSKEEQNTTLGTHYGSMSIMEMCALPIRSMTQDNSVLFMWVTSPLLAECFEVIKSWGFEYKTSIVWDKMAHNVGHYVSVRHEFLLICTRGSCTPDIDKLLPSVVSEKRGEHSVKPESFRTMIDTMYPLGDRIELFARRPAKGWKVWGNDV
jgi:N6-adenosine-specific RNA methylase IME4